MLAVALGQIATALAAPLVALAGFPVAYVMWVAHVAGGRPARRRSVPAGLVAVACLAAALAVGVRRARPPVVLGAVVALALGAVLSRTQAAGLAAPAGLRITFLDVGQGDATLIQWRHSAILVDTGPPDGPVLARLRHAGVRRLDLLVVTHAQADHEGGAAACWRAAGGARARRARRRPRGQRRAAGSGGGAGATCALVAARAGEVLRVGGIALRVLWPGPRARGAGGGPQPARDRRRGRCRRGARRCSPPTRSPTCSGPGPRPGRRPEGLPPRQRRSWPARAAAAPAPAAGGDRGRAPQRVRPSGAATSRAAGRGRDGRAYRPRRQRERRAGGAARCASTRMP